MSKNVKKLLSVFAAIAMLVSVIVPAGVLPTMAETEPEQEVVTAPSAIDVTEYTVTATGLSGDKTYVNHATYYHTAGSRVIISFDYYVTNANGDAVYIDNLNLFDENGNRGTYGFDENEAKVDNGSLYFMRGNGAGVGHYERELITDAAVNWRFHGVTANTKVYVWNFSYRFKDSGEEITPRYDLGSDRANPAYVVTGKSLADFDWGMKEFYKNDPTVTLVDFAEGGATPDGSGYTYWGAYGLFSRGNAVSVDGSVPTKDANGNDIAAADDQWNISFDYYKNDSTQIIAMGSGTFSWDLNARQAFSTGIGKYSLDFKISNASGRHVYFRGKTSKLYVWNFKITLNGHEVTMNGGASTLSGAASFNAVDTGKRLSTFEWTQLSTEEANATVLKINFSKLPTSVQSSTTWFVGDDGRGIYTFTDHVSSANPDASGVTTRTLSFDYYLPSECSYVLRHQFRTADDYRDDTTGDAVLRPGVNHFEDTFTATSGNYRFGIGLAKNPNAPAEVLSDLYIWNFKFTNGTQTKTLPTSADMDSSCTFAKTVNPATGVKFTAAEAVEVLKYKDIYSMVNQDANTTVAELDFTQSEPTDDEGVVNYTASLYTGKITEKTGTHTLSFDYYIPNAGVNAYVCNGNNSYANQYADAKSPNGSFWLIQGHHKFINKNVELSGGANYEFNFVMRSNKTLGKIYVWNVSLTNNAGSSNHLAGAHYKVNAQAGKVATVTEHQVPAGKLADVAKIDNEGTQIRAGQQADLRFVGSAKVDGVVYNKGEAADYSKATIVIDGVRYKALQVGMLFARDSKLNDLPENALVVGSDDANVKLVEAAKIQSPDYAADKDINGIVFTTVIKDIPAANQAETISLRSFVKYLDMEGKVAYQYGEIISRSYNKTVELAG